MKTVIFGIGKMGTAIAFAMRELGHYVVGVDSISAGKNKLKEVLGDDNFVFYSTTNLDYDLGGILEFEKPDVVISSLPYHQTLTLAKYCIINKLRYCDLGGSVGVSEKINSFAEERAAKPIMTDLGLAPGWVNIVAEWGCREVHGTPEKIKMMVGGLPVSEQTPPLNYATTWSIDGLINEYRDDCEILQGGKAVKVKGMEGYEKVYCDRMGKKLEAFYTSGGASHTIRDMESRGVKECSYKTLRYIGHRNAVRFLIRDCELSEDCLIQIFKKGCEDAGRGDVVVMKAKVEKGDLKWEKEIVVCCNEKFSAMQRATAFPISAVASLMAEGKLEGNKDQHRDYHTQYPHVLTYKDILTEEFNKKINILGLEV